MIRRLSLLLSITVMIALGCGSSEEEAPATEEFAGEVAPPPETPEMTTPAPEISVPEEVTPQPPPTVERDTRGRFTVQVSSWRTRRKADAEAEKLRDRGYDAYVQKAWLVDQEAWYRVRVGSFATIAEARRFAATLEELLESGYWVDRLRTEGSPTQ